jgi:hypothetical protein
VAATQRIIELERERSEQWDVLELASARIRGIDAELERLKAGAKHTKDYSDTPLTEAILAVLRSSPSAMSPSQVIAGLAVGGRVEPANKVNATLSHLKQRGHVRCEGRASWRST